MVGLVGLMALQPTCTLQVLKIVVTNWTVATNWHATRHSTTTRAPTIIMFPVDTPTLSQRYSVRLVSTHGHRLVVLGDAHVVKNPRNLDYGIGTQFCFNT